MIIRKQILLVILPCDRFSLNNIEIFAVLQIERVFIGYIESYLKAVNVGNFNPFNLDNFRNMFANTCSMIVISDTN